MTCRVFTKRRVEHVEYGTGTCVTDSSPAWTQGEIKRRKHLASHPAMGKGSVRL